MIYLDNSATSFHKPPQVLRGVLNAMEHCANPGRGDYPAAMEAARQVYRCREVAGLLFDCRPEQVVMTSNCTHGLNIAIRSLVRPGSRVVVSGFEHNAVTRPLHRLKADIQVAGDRLFDPENTLEQFARILHRGMDAAVFTHVSNVFGYILPVKQMADLCRQHGVPFILDAAQSAGTIPISLKELGADFVAMPGHKGLLGPQGTGLLLCRAGAEPLMQGGTGNASLQQTMPEDLPERLEPGTLNVPGIAGLAEGIRWLKQTGVERIGHREHSACMRCAKGLQALGMKVFTGPDQAGTVSFLPGMDCEEAAQELGRMGFAVRAGLHCAPMAHSTAGTVQTGTVRISFGPDCNHAQTDAFLRSASKLPRFQP